MCNAIQERLIQERLVENEVYEAMMRMRHRINDVLGMPTPNSEYAPKENYPTNANASAPPRRHGNSREWEYVYGDGTIPEPKKYDGAASTAVMAVGDMERDPNRPIAPYIPPTDPQNDTNPFPMLNGPMG